MADGGGIYLFPIKGAEFSVDLVPTVLSDDLTPEQWGAIARAVSAVESNRQSHFRMFFCIINFCVCCTDALCTCCYCSNAATDHQIEEGLRRQFFHLNTELFGGKPVLTIKHGTAGGQIQINTQYLVAMRRDSHIQEMSMRNMAGLIAAGGPMIQQQDIPIVEATVMPVPDGMVRGMIRDPPHYEEGNEKSFQKF